MLYAQAVAAYLPVRALRVATLGEPGVGVFEDALAAQLIYGPILGIEHPMTGQGGFVVQGPNMDLPIRVGNRPLVSAAVGAWLNDYGLALYRPVLDHAAYPTRTIDPKRPPAWILKPWGVTNLPVTQAYQQAWDVMMGIWARVYKVGVLPPKTEGRIRALLQAGFLVFPKSTTVSLPGQTTEQRAAWQVMADEMRTLVKLAAAENMNALRVEGEKLAANADFWEGIERAVRAVATVGLSEIGPHKKGGWWLLGVGAMALFAVARGAFRKDKR